MLATSPFNKIFPVEEPQAVELVTEEELITGVVFTTPLILAGVEEQPVLVIMSEYEPATDEDAFVRAGLWVVLGVLKPGPVQL